MVKPFIYADVINPKTSFILFTNYKFNFYFILNFGVKCELDAFFTRFIQKAKLPLRRV